MSSDAQETQSPEDSELGIAQERSTTEDTELDTVQGRSETEGLAAPIPVSSDSVQADRDKEEGNLVEAPLAPADDPDVDRRLAAAAQMLTRIRDLEVALPEEVLHALAATGGRCRQSKDTLVPLADSELAAIEAQLAEVYDDALLAETPVLGDGTESTGGENLIRYQQESAPAWHPKHESQHWRP